MIDLTEEQSRELAATEPLVRNPATGETYVLVRRDVYERLRHLFEDNTALSKRELSRLVEQVMREYDEGDPTLQLYQDD